MMNEGLQSKCSPEACGEVEHRRGPGHSRWQGRLGGGQAAHNLLAGGKMHRDLAKETPNQLELPS
eukprot:12922786-Prorocentrum_lima.AAC.1